jgi:hypothetical protein
VDGSSKLIALNEISAFIDSLLVEDHFNNDM